MPIEPSPFFVIAFVSLVLTCLALVLVAIAHVAPRSKGVGTRPAWLVPAIAMVALLVVSAVVAASGILRHWDRFPPPPLIPMTLVTVATVVFATRSRLGSQLAFELPLSALILFQAFRLPLELLLHRAYVESVLPVQMTYAGLNFDILTGLGALAIGWVARSRPVPTALVWAWNGMGAVLLIFVVSIALLSMPTPFRSFMNEPSTAWVTYPPYIWLPLVLVQLALAGHILITRRLLKTRA